MNAENANDILKELKKNKKEVKEEKKNIKEEKKIISIVPKKCKCYFYYYKLNGSNTPPHDFRLQLQKFFCTKYKNKKISDIIGPGEFENEDGIPDGTDIKLKYHEYRVIFDNKEEIIKYIKECGNPNQKFDLKMFNWLKNIEEQQHGDVDLGY